MLLPVNTIQGVTRYKYFKNGIQLLVFDQRIGFHNLNNMITTVEGSPFASAYFCRNLLPKDLIIEHLNKYNAPLYITPVRIVANLEPRLVCRKI